MLCQDKNGPKTLCENHITAEDHMFYTQKFHHGLKKDPLKIK